MFARDGEGGYAVNRWVGRKVGRLEGEGGRRGREEEGRWMDGSCK